MTRRELRDYVFKIIFQAEFNEPGEMKIQEQLFLLGLEELSTEEKAEVKNRADAVLAKKDEIDMLLNANITGWSTERIGKVELAILRLAVFELSYDDDIPEGVAINEAVEMAKTYGPDSAGQFVNGVLAKLV